LGWELYETRVRIRVVLDPVQSPVRFPRDPLCVPVGLWNRVTRTVEPRDTGCGTA